MMKDEIEKKKIKKLKKKLNSTCVNSAIYNLRYEIRIT